jgi:hypothetical protein
VAGDFMTVRQIARVLKARMGSPRRGAVQAARHWVVRLVC